MKKRRLLWILLLALILAALPVFATGKAEEAKPEGTIILFTGGSSQVLQVKPRRSG